MKIFSVSLETDLGRRTAQFAVPVDVEPLAVPLGGESSSAAPPHFVSSVTELLWRIIREHALKGAAIAAAIPKAEA